MNTNCLHCSAVLRKPDQIKFCSVRCSNLSLRGIKEKPCDVCGKSFKGVYSRQIYCCKSCSIRGRSPHRHETDSERRERLRLKNLLNVRKYQAKCINQTPDDADHLKIREIYANCPEGYEVDHIIPISKGGQHHQDNLQYLPWLENRRKGSKLNYTPMAERLGT